MRHPRIARLALSFLAAGVPCLAAVSSIDITSRGDVLGGASFGNTGPYEYIAAKVHFALDPRLRPNRIITDIDLAPKNSNGQVEFAADLFLLRPRNPSGGNGTALVEISNRGGKALPYEFDFAHPQLNPQSAETLGDGFLLRRGFTLVWIGWEWDVPSRAELMKAYLPIATERGRAITGVVRSEWTGEKREGTISLGDKGQTGYPVLNPDSQENKLFVRDSVLGERTLVPHSAWKFDGASSIELSGGFGPGRIYEVVYETKDPVVSGLGLAAVRDFVSFLKYGGTAGTALNVEAHSIKRAIGFGVSQSGRFLREYLYDGFNEDEAHREVFDGVWAHVAGAGRGSFNQRFAQPSRDGHEFLNVFYPVDLPPFDEESLLARSHQAHVVPKLFLTNGAYEYWGRCASLIHTTADGRADAPPLPGTRIYFFAGSQHTVGSIPPRPALAQNATNTNDYRYALRALLVAMQDWLATGKEPPQSQFPQLSKGELTAPADLRFPRIPGINLPQRQREAYRLDFSAEPPKVGPPFPTFVPQVDVDGNDLGGIRMPEVAVPLASYTGWNLRDPSIGAPGELLSFVGSWLPFARTEQEGEDHRDPRPAISRRYADEKAYLRAINSASQDLARLGFVLEADFGLLNKRAAQEWNYRQQLK